VPEESPILDPIITTSAFLITAAIAIITVGKKLNIKPNSSPPIFTPEE